MSYFFDRGQKNNILNKLNNSVDLEMGLTQGGLLQMLESCCLNAAVDTLELFGSFYDGGFFMFCGSVWEFHF